MPALLSLCLLSVPLKMESRCPSYLQCIELNLTCEGGMLLSALHTMLFLGGLIAPRRLLESVRICLLPLESCHRFYLPSRCQCMLRLCGHHPPTWVPNQGLLSVCFLDVQTTCLTLNVEQVIVANTHVGRIEKRKAFSCCRTTTSFCVCKATLVGQSLGCGALCKK